MHCVLINFYTCMYMYISNMAYVVSGLSATLYFTYEDNSLIQGDELMISLHEIDAFCLETYDPLHTYPSWICSSLVHNNRGHCLPGAQQIGPLR